MQIGKLRHKITIENVTETISDVGETVEEWDEFAKVWAEISPLRGREYWASKQTTSEITGKIMIRYLADITSKMRIKFGERIFNIEAVLNTDERKIETILLVSEQK